MEVGAGLAEDVAEETLRKEGNRLGHEGGLGQRLFEELDLEDLAEVAALATLAGDIRSVSLQEQVLELDEVGGGQFVVDIVFDLFIPGELLAGVFGDVEGRLVGGVNFDQFVGEGTELDAVIVVIETECNFNRVYSFANLTL